MSSRDSTPYGYLKSLPLVCSKEISEKIDRILFYSSAEIANAMKTVDVFQYTHSIEFKLPRDKNGNIDFVCPRGEITPDSLVLFLAELGYNVKEDLIRERYLSKIQQLVSSIGLQEYIENPIFAVISVLYFVYNASLPTSDELSSKIKSVPDNREKFLTVVEVLVDNLKKYITDLTERDLVIGYFDTYIKTVKEEIQKTKTAEESVKQLLKTHEEIGHKVPMPVEESKVTKDPYKDLVYNFIRKLDQLCLFTLNPTESNINHISEILVKKLRERGIFTDQIPFDRIKDSIDEIKEEECKSLDKLVRKSAPPVKWRETANFIYNFMSRFITGKKEPEKVEVESMEERYKVQESRKSEEDEIAYQVMKEIYTTVTGGKPFNLKEEQVRDFLASVFQMYEKAGVPIEKYQDLFNIVTDIVNKVREAGYPDLASAVGRILIPDAEYQIKDHDIVKLKQIVDVYMAYSNNKISEDRFIERIEGIIGVHKEVRPAPTPVQRQVEQPRVEEEEEKKPRIPEIFEEIKDNLVILNSQKEFMDTLHSKDVKEAKYAYVLVHNDTVYIYIPTQYTKRPFLILDEEYANRVRTMLSSIRNVMFKGFGNDIIGMLLIDVTVGSVGLSPRYIIPIVRYNGGKLNWIPDDHIIVKYYGKENGFGCFYAYNEGSTLSRVSVSNGSLLVYDRRIIIATEQCPSEEVQSGSEFYIDKNGHIEMASEVK